METRFLNYRFHGGWIATLGLCGLFSLVKVSNTIALWNDQRATDRAHNSQIAAIEHDAAITQAKISNHINIYDSVTLSDYVCDPAAAPQFDASIFARDGEPVPVADRNQRVIGHIEPNGAFTFNPNNCK